MSTPPASSPAAPTSRSCWLTAKEWGVPQLHPVSARQGTILEQRQPLHLAHQRRRLFLPSSARRPDRLYPGRTVRAGRRQPAGHRQRLSGRCGMGKSPPTPRKWKWLQDVRVMARQGETWSEAGQIEITRFPQPHRVGQLWGEPVAGDRGLRRGRQRGAHDREFGQIFAPRWKLPNVDLSTELPN